MEARGRGEGAILVQTLADRIFTIVRERIIAGVGQAGTGRGGLLDHRDDLGAAFALQDVARRQHALRSRV
jgi:hypothetical protein